MTQHTNRSKLMPRLVSALAAMGCLVLGLFLLSGSLSGNKNAPSSTGDNTSLDARPAADTPRPAGSISFNRDIRPILSENCFACHGPDAAVSKDAGGFRLDTFETATVPATSGEIPIVPGDADASTVIKRVLSKSANLQMPPPKSHLKLTADQVALLKQWIDEGAKYEGHWAYQTPVKPELPKLTDDNKDWARNAVDHFIAAKLQAAGLSPSEQADKPTLIRRLSLDLVGLPPTPQEIDAFVNDTSDNAYDKLVDRLLDSPHFGERLALIWLDAARYADTNGFHHDNIRTAWPWRQWVIESFNNNKPYNEFIIEQLAGDLLPNATQEQILASAFCRMHNINDEGGALDAEYLVEAIADRIETIGTVMMAQTYTCSRCHDHKYDPITQDDYYSTWAYFNSIDERGVYPNNRTEARAYPPRIIWKSEELQAQIADAQARKAQIQKQLKAAEPEFDAQLKIWEDSIRMPTAVAWAQAKLTSASSSNASTKVQIKPDGSALLSGEPPANEDISLTLRTDAKDLRLIRLDALTDPSFTKNGIGRSNNGNAVLTQFIVQAVSVANPTQKIDIKLSYAWADSAQQDADYDIFNALRDDKLGWALGGHLDDAPRTALFVADQPFGFEGGTDVHITLRNQSQHAKHTLGRVRVGLASVNANVIDAFPIVTEDWFQIGPFDGEFPKALDERYGPEDATTISPSNPAIRGQEWKHRPDLVDDKAHTFRSGKNVFYYGRSIFSPDERKLNLNLGKRSALQLYLNGQEVHTHKEKAPAKGNDQITITLRPGENTIVAKVTKNGPGNFYFMATPEGGTIRPLQPIALIDKPDRPAHLMQQIVKSWQENTELGKKLAASEKEVEQLEAQGVPVLIMKEKPNPVPAYVLERGAYDKPIKERVRERRPPLFMGVAMPKDAPNNRLGFAQWLTQPDHPLTARVHVNRIWQMLFGYGIVKTVEDFGSQSDWPSHPGLLDHLAVDFVQSDWDQKALIKQIVMSATYRQRAVKQIASLDLDADNRLLSYFPRRRLAGELIRDQALFVSGLLNDQIGGPSVKPYQPGDLWNEVAIGGTNTGNFKRDSGEALYRRSMYTFWKRTSPPPQMATFNAPTREFCVVSRDVTNTPLQALTLWNDEQFLEASRVLAQRTLVEAKQDEQRLQLIFRRCTGSKPNAEATQVLAEMLDYYRKRYATAPDDAKALLTQGDYPLPEAHDPAELASWMMVASSVLSLDATIVRD